MDRVSRRRFLGGAGAALGLALLGKAPRGLAAGMAPRVEYRLPYPGGVTWRVVQGNNTTGTHQGYFAYAWDFRMPVGSPITAARGGVVSGVKQDSDEHGWGPAYADKNNYILIDHGDGTTGEYLHIPRDGARVRVGQRVEQGEMIGFSGFTGRRAARTCTSWCRSPRPAPGTPSPCRSASPTCPPTTACLSAPTSTARATAATPNWS